MSTKTKFRNYPDIRNYAEHKCIKVSHSLSWSEMDDVVYEMQYETEKRFTCNGEYFFFEDNEDACLFALKYGAKQTIC